jgi:uncharacterized protein YoaH (UPF0181 family)
MQTTISEVARMRQHIAAEYLSAQLGLFGLAEGTTRHSFITTKMERMGESFETLAEMMGKGQAIQIVAETLQEVPERATRQNVLQALLHELGDTEATQHLLDYIQDMWSTLDLLTERFGPEATRTIIDAPVSLLTKEVMCS